MSFITVGGARREKRGQREREKCSEQERQKSLHVQSWCYAENMENTDTHSKRALCEMYFGQVNPREYTTIQTEISGYNLFDS